MEKISETKSRCLEKTNKINKLKLNEHYIYPVVWHIIFGSITLLQKHTFAVGSMSLAEFLSSFSYNY